MTNTVIITGASQGIGKATALQFARHGYNIVLAARQPDRLEEAASEVRAIGRDALAVSADVREPEQVDALVEKAIAHFGSINVLINNASIFALGPVDEFLLSDWQQVINTNLWGYIHTIHALLPHFLKQGSGTIVNVSSIGGIEPIPYQTPYTVSKYAVTVASLQVVSLQSPVVIKEVQAPEFIHGEPEKVVPSVALHEAQNVRFQAPAFRHGVLLTTYDLRLTTYFDRADQSIACRIITQRNSGLWNLSKFHQNPYY